MADVSSHNQLILHKTIVFVGMMGAGKTAVGRTLAAHLGVMFRDSDHEIEEAANMTIAEIFARDGEPFFRRKEHQVIDRLLDGVPGVLSTGGGAFMSADNRQMITDKGVSVWLDADIDLLWERVRHKDTRPLLKTPDPYGTLKSLYEARVPVYAKADIVVKSEPGLSLDAMAEKVAQALLAQRPDVLERPL
ncbi:shikimate kinase [Tropicibacter naphthalenivorans]|uniref:Shikimate kinase n=1 Tax=Tropicibacter naphthalenivorans TaxID=441103 RepID=A0A0P1GPH0_9RHOB|nr:shikimate kinase [Tropicibacter naphthalenivorans]CUH77141.1 Shikimate kinase [Tropicibacter naphthalenivorans]SMC60440.1 shikimate kinase [Tropicibacter naphthalenivorans]